MDTTFNSNIDKKTEFYGGLRVTLTFDLANLFNKTGKPVFSSPSVSESNNTYLEDRIFDRVVRDIDVQSKTSTTPSNGQSLIYVNDTAAGGGNGTLANPYNTISAGISAAVSTGKWVYVEGKNTTPYSGDITLPNNVVLWGSGYNGGFNGLPVSGVFPIISGGTNGITLGNANTVMGLQIQNATNDGITFTNGITLTGTIQNNYIIGNYYNGIDLSDNLGKMSNFIICNNTIYNSIEDGINLSYNSEQNHTGTMANFFISNNNIYNNNDGIDLSYNGFYYGNGTMTNFTISNNTINDNHKDGIDLTNNGLAYGNGTMSYFTISNNAINNNANGIDLRNNGVLGNGTLSSFIISNNTISGNAESGLIFNFNGEQNGNGVINNFSIFNNTLTSNYVDGIEFSYNGSDFGNGTIENINIFNNTISNNNGVGIDLSSNGFDSGIGNMTNFTFSNNAIYNNDNNGIDISQNYGSISDVTFLHNIITGNSQDGIILANAGSGSMSDINLGNGTAGGENSIYGNDTSGGYYDIYNDSGINNLPAEDNWWGQVGGPGAGKIGGLNSVNSTNPLSVNPN